MHVFEAKNIDLKVSENHGLFQIEGKWQQNKIWENLYILS